MTLAKLLEVQRGKRSLRLFRSVESGTLFMAVDKVVGTRRIRGPFLSESDIRCLVDLLDRHRPTHLWRSEHRARWLVGERAQPTEHISYDATTAQLEIEQAIRRARKGRPVQKRSAITVVPSIPKYTYCHTCSVCGCHIESTLRLGPGAALKVCPNCEHVHAATG